MSIHFTKNDENLFLHYEPDFDGDSIQIRLELGEEIHPKHCFNLNKGLLLRVEEEFNHSFIFIADIMTYDDLLERIRHIAELT